MHLLNSFERIVVSFEVHFLMTITGIPLAQQAFQVRDGSRKHGKDFMHVTRQSHRSNWEIGRDTHEKSRVDFKENLQINYSTLSAEVVNN